MRYLLYFLASALLFCFPANLQSQTQPFTLVVNTGLPALAHSWVSWGDYDRDGDLDIAICGDSAGIPKSFIYRNDDGAFHNTGFSLPQLSNGSMEWGDADNNGWLELLMTGTDLNGDTKAFIIPNNGGIPGTSPLSLPVAVSYGQAHWGDYDNDGRIDILMAGNFTAKILHNDGNLSFSDINAPLPAVSNASCNWVDYNNDGQPDAFVCGHVDVGDVSKLFRNDHGIFTTVSVEPSGLTGLSYGNSRWADLDMDGRMDLLISGVDTLTGNILIYQNMGNDVFYKNESYTFNIFSTNMDIADYDNDGRPDFIINGRLHSCGGSALTLLYHNEGDMTFTNVYTDISGFALGGTEFADYNNDGFSDLLLSGTDNNGAEVTTLYKNTSGASRFSINTPPSEPSGLGVLPAGNAVTLTWNKATDAETSSPGLTYNLFIGSSGDSADVMDPMSDRSSGFRRIAASGNSNQDTSWTIRDLPQGTYYWSVQAIDNGFMPSEFAPVQSFNFTPNGIPRPELQTISASPNPCHDRIYLGIPAGCDVEVYDSRGIMMLDCKYADGIDVSQLPPGLYFAKILSDSQVTSISFIKK